MNKLILAVTVSVVAIGGAQSTLAGLLIAGRDHYGETTLLAFLLD